MIAYFALLSFVPLLFLSLALLSTAGQATEGSFFIRELHRTFPSTSLDSLLRAVRAIRENATALGIFVFLASAYVVLTNDDLTWREVLPGAAAAAIALEATFQFLPAFVRISKHNPVLQTLSGPAVLLVWLYVMANVIVLGAEVNWHRRYGVRRAARAPRARDGNERVSSRHRAPRLSGRSRRE